MIRAIDDILLIVQYKIINQSSMIFTYIHMSAPLIFEMEIISNCQNTYFNFVDMTSGTSKRVN